MKDIADYIQLHHDSFSFRLLLCIFTTAFLLLAAGSLIMYNLSVDATTKINNERLQESLAITAQNIDSVFDSCNITARIALGQENVISNLRKPFVDKSPAYYSIQHALVTAVSVNNATSHISLLDNWGNVISTSASDVSSVSYHSKKECLNYFDLFGPAQIINNQSWYFTVPDPLQPTKYAIVNMRDLTLSTFDTAKPILIITLSEEYLSSIYDFLGDDSFIVLDNGLIVSALDKQRIGTFIDATFIGQFDKAISMHEAVHIEKVSWNIVTLPKIRGYLVVNSVDDVISATNHIITDGVVVILIIGLIFSIIWAKHISSSMTRPLVEAKARIEEVRNGNMNMRCKVIRRDEVGYLCESFNQMMDRLEMQIQEKNEQQNRAKENELRFLQSQINPHLLYNSLDSALFLITVNDTTKSAEVLEELSKYFKLALHKGSKIVTLDKAIEHIRSYVKLQNLCRSKHYTLSISGNEELLNAKILHMLIQPSVENSVLHGFCGSFDDGEIEVTYYRSGTNLIIKVSDNGIGMTIDELESLKKSLSSPIPSVKCYGLWNVAERIRMYYGNDYSIEVESEFGEGTEITFILPYLI